MIYILHFNDDIIYFYDSRNSFWIDSESTTTGYPYLENGNFNMDIDSEATRYGLCIICKNSKINYNYKLSI